MSEQEELNIESEPTIVDNHPPVIKKEDAPIDTQEAKEPLEPLEPTEPVVMKKKRGHRPKNPYKMIGTERTTCPDCNKSLSKHTLAWKHKCPAKQIKVEPIKEVVETEASSSNDAPKRIEVIKQQPSRRVLDLDATIDHRNEDVRHVVQSYVKSIRENHHLMKQQRYKTLLTGRL